MDYSTEFAVDDIDSKFKQKVKEALKRDDKALTLGILSSGVLPQTVVTTSKGNQYTCLHHCAYINSFKALEACIETVKEQFADNAKGIFNIQNKYGNTPVMHAAKKNNFESFVLLMSHGAYDLELKDSKGQTLEEMVKEADPCIQKVFQKTLEQAEDADVEEKIEQNVEATKSKKLKKNLRRKKAKKEEDEEKEEDPDLEGIPKDSKTYALIKEYKEKGENFIDPDFPHETESICHPDDPNFSKFESTGWSRVHEIIGCDVTETKLIDGIDPNDVK